MPSIERHVMPLSVSRMFSKRIFDDGLAAVSDRSHPCHHMMARQVEGGIQPVQLPEPFSGNRSTLRLVFIGLNPSLSVDDKDIPRASKEWDFQQFDIYYRRRFASMNRNSHGKPVVSSISGGGAKVPRLWNNIELFGRRFLSDSSAGSFKLGEHAILMDVVHYKSLDGWFGNKEKKKGLFQHQSFFTKALINELAPCVLVPMGNEACRQMCHLLGLESEAQRSITQLNGQTLKARTENREQVLITPIKHLSRPPSREIQAAVGKEIRRSIGKLA